MQIFPTTFLEKAVFQYVYFYLKAFQISFQILTSSTTACTLKIKSVVIKSYAKLDADVNLVRVTEPRIERSYFFIGRLLTLG